MPTETSVRKMCSTSGDQYLSMFSAIHSGQKPFSATHPAPERSRISIWPRTGEAYSSAAGTSAAETRSAPERVCSGGICSACAIVSSESTPATQPFASRTGP